MVIVILLLGEDDMDSNVSLVYVIFSYNISVLKNCLINVYINV